MSTAAVRYSYATAPERSVDQRMRALELANDIRSRRAQLKRDLKAARCSATLLIAAPPEWIASMRVLDLLMATPKIGRVKAQTMLNRAGVAPIKTVGGLSSRQRDALVGALRGRGIA